ncbi:hypothetical protein RJT34_24106 [Clitoria ternatea]|uniref:Uncharacterized protein n=1 Tax=Clitoria ternatea TaxID=43366 RepID=A0AAN9FM93_CLITE
MPQIAGYFVPLLKKWSVEYAGSSFNLASVDKLHELATGAGFKLNFLSHFGGKVFPIEKTEDLEFWIGLAHKKLLKAFCEENMVSSKQNFQQKRKDIPSYALHDYIFEQIVWPHWGFFAYLGRRTRIFLSATGINDLDEMVKDFLSYLEWGILFIYPEFSSTQVYQVFMEKIDYLASRMKGAVGREEDI